ncbi:MAG: hypothetical protein J3K34DRAFT_404500 [Monoraphidium minutum]|nr:MAG: hypothetical protein J3K34DRAFT_404500 [Monoraphidium minutum]
MATWQGPLLHRRAGAAAAAELCRLAVQLPAAYRARLPPALAAAELAPRRAVPLGRHVVCRCAPLAGGAPRQAAALSALAAAERVAVVPLEGCKLVIVPYQDGGGRTRVVAFLRLLDGA